MKKVGISCDDLIIEIHPIINFKNEQFIEKPKLLIKIKNKKQELKYEYLTDSIKVDDVEYCASYMSHEWLSKNKSVDQKVKLPSGEIVTEEEFKTIYFSETPLI